MNGPEYIEWLESIFKYCDEMGDVSILEMAYKLMDEMGISYARAVDLAVWYFDGK